ncbi:hypothetical protein VO64_3350 [Pseudomonas synxantha]|uniref:Uncharacterized protein n=1 Tax=Pseudomonas synxantha TaxID=47883 RepID=A0AAU8TNZ6_9PSED|nr:hypothetical protein VO64_3350 [Pseudomonas synxantha]
MELLNIKKPYKSLVSWMQSSSTPTGVVIRLKQKYIAEKGL